MPSFNKTSNLMPPESIPEWDRFRDRKRGYNISGGGGSGNGSGSGRWRDSPSSPFATGSRNSNEFSPRLGFPSFEFRRPPGHGKQGGRSLYQEDSHRGYSTPRSGDRFLEDDSFRASGPHGNGRYGRFYRDNRNDFGQKEWRGRSRESNQQYNGPINTSGRPLNMNKQRSVGNSPVRPSHPISEPSAQLNSKDQADKTDGANGSGVSQGIGKENSLECLNWKPLKWSRLESLAPRGSGFNHSSSSKSTGGESSDVKDDLAPKMVSFIKSPSVDAAAAVCAPSSVSAEETASRKKARLGWGEGLAKFENKKVEGQEENVASYGNMESTHPFTSNLADKSPKITSFSDGSSPATPSFACSLSSGLEKTYRKTADGDSNNFCVSSMPLAQNQTEGTRASLGKLELNSVTNLSSLLNELLQVDEHFSTDSGFMRSSAFNKLVLWKCDISKALELTETDIDSLENELKLLNDDSHQGVHYSGLSNFSYTGDKDANCDGPNGFNRPYSLKVVSSEGVGNTPLSQHAGGAHTENKDEDIDSPGTATSQFVEPRLIQKPVSHYGLVESSKTVPGNFFTCDIKEKIEGTTCQGDDAKAINDDVVAAVVKQPGVCNKKVHNICDLILACNKETTFRASEMLTKLPPSEKIDNHSDSMEAFRLSCLPVDTKIKEKFMRRRRFLKFKERVISLKYRAFYHIWKEDMGLLSLRSHKMKPHKKFDVTSRATQTGNQKHRQSIPARFASQDGSSTLVPSTEILDITRKLLSDSEVKIHRRSLKMPAMILDDKEKISSRFVSRNGLVEDPCAVEKERALTNPWTIEEKDIFMEKLSTFGKDFRKIASFLDHKTIADCIQFYYKNHKSESFEKTKKLNGIKQAKDTYMLTSEKKWGRNMNSASLDLLGAASVIAAEADRAIKNSKPLSGNFNNKKRRVFDGFIEVSTKFDAAQSEREIEAMSSCITGLVDSEKLCSSFRQPLTPDAAHNVNDDGGNDDSCSDECYGEVDSVDWTDDEKSLFVQAFSSHGKDFLVISHFVRTKTREQCKVFFSKAQKCLGLENSNPRSWNKGLPRSNDTNGSESDIEDDCDIETGSVGCSGKAGSRNDEDLNHVSQDVSGPDSIIADLSTSGGNRQLDCKDTDMVPEVLCPGNDMDLESVSEATNEKSVSTYDSLHKESVRFGSSLGSQSLPVALSVEVEMNHDTTHNNMPEAHNVNSQVPLLPKSDASSDTEKPCRSGDVKLFGKILSKPSSVDISTSIPQRYNKTATQHLTSGIMGLENVPVRNYGIWDGSKIQVVSYPPMKESSSDLLLAKYPDAFASRRALQVPIDSSGCNLNNACEFSPREYNNGSASFVDYTTFRNRNVFPSPFTLDFKQCHNGVPEVQRNGFNAMSSSQSRGKAPVNLSVVQGGDLSAGQCTGVSDPVATLQMQYSHQQLGGSGVGGRHTLNGVVREESWGSLAGVGR